MNYSDDRTDTIAQQTPLILKLEYMGPTHVEHQYIVYLKLIFVGILRCILHMCIFCSYLLLRTCA